VRRALRAFEASMHHARERAIERYGVDVYLPLITEKIKEGQARLVTLARSETGVLRQIYDVPYPKPGGEEMSIRVIVNADTKFVISVLPPEFHRESVERQFKEKKRDEKQAKRRFFRDLDDEDDAELAPA
jgi:hypothetical protein